jgi:DNA-binding response OmpR family regulator
MDERPILIVDDTPEIRDLIADTLIAEGYTVAWVSKSFSLPELLATVDGTYRAVNAPA